MKEFSSKKTFFIFRKSRWLHEKYIHHDTMEMKLDMKRMLRIYFPATIINNSSGFTRLPIRKEKREIAGIRRRDGEVGGPAGGSTRTRCYKDVPNEITKETRTSR